MYHFSNHQMQELEHQLEILQRSAEITRNILRSIQQDSGNLFFDDEGIYPSRAMSKSELAATQHISTKQLGVWLKPLRQQLREKGVSDRAHLLKPEIVHFICKELHITCIDLAQNDISS